MTTDTQTNSAPQSPVSPTPPVVKGDSHSYKGWLNSDSFLKRAFAIYGYGFVASLIISIPIFIIAIIIGVVGALSFMGGMMAPLPMNTSGETIVGEEVFIDGKLNINEICDESLMYTTFQSGREADLYLKDCKEGKHPEVIERYKADMGLGDGREV